MGTDDRRKATGARPAADRTSHYTLERFSELIGSIYDCALDPKNWGPTLENINREFTFICSALGVIPLRSGGQIVNANAGIDSEWLARGDEYRADAVDMWGGAERMQRFPIDEPIVHSQAIGSARLIGNRYFHEIFEPRGIFDAVGITIAREPSLLGYLAFSRHSSAGDIEEAEVEGLRLLAPHFRRAVTISDLFDMKAIEAASFASALDSFSFGILLVDEALGIVHANRTA